MRPSSAGLGFRDTNPGPSRGASRTKAYALVVSGCLCLFLANCGGDAGFEGANLLIMAADGSGLENVTDDAEPDWQPDWSADASRIVFARGPSDPLDLYVVDVDGGKMRPLVVADGRDEQPKWRPRPR